MKKIKTSYLLVGCVAVMALLCIMSIGGPIHFDSQRKVRETAVKTRLMAIRSAEERYRARHGVYAGNFNSLVKNGYLADSMRYIPYTDKKSFELQATTITGKGGQDVPLMECRAKYVDFLDGLDRNSVANVIEDANSSGGFPGLKIGDINTPNNNAGNWE